MNNPYNIQINAYPMGNDFTFLITGGVAHIGAVATAYWENDNIQVNVIELPHHKEGELAKECAILASRLLECTVAVSMGIHIDNATKEQITEIVDYVRIEMTDKVHTLKETKTTSSEHAPVK